MLEVITTNIFSVEYHSIPFQSNWVLLTKYKEISLETVEVIEYHDSLSHLKDNRGITKISEILTDQDNSKYNWNLDIHATDLNLNFEG